MNSAVASCTAGPGGGARHAATSAKRAMRSIGAMINSRRIVGLVVLLNEPRWMGSEDRRLGKQWVRTFRYRGLPDYYIQKETDQQHACCNKYYEAQAKVKD